MFTRKHSRQVESARKYANHPFACNLSRIPICMIFAGLKVVLFKRETFVSEFLFKLFDREKVLHNCNRQNIHVAETTCTPASAIFLLVNIIFSVISVPIHSLCGSITKTIKKFYSSTIKPFDLKHGGTYLYMTLIKPPFLRLFLRMQNGSYGMSGDLKPSFLHSFSRSDVNKRPLTDGWQTYM